MPAATFAQLLAPSAAAPNELAGAVRAAHQLIASSPRQTGGSLLRLLHAVLAPVEQPLHSSSPSALDAALRVLHGFARADSLRLPLLHAGALRSLSRLSLDLWSNSQSSDESILILTLETLVALTREQFEQPPHPIIAALMNRVGGRIIDGPAAAEEQAGAEADAEEEHSVLTLL